MMYLITNRAMEKKKGLKAFGKTPNPAGSNELRLVHVTRTDKSWKVTVLADRLSEPTVKSLDNYFNLGIDVTAPWFGSLKVACELFEQARNEKKSILFFIHGFNNDVEDVLEAAFEIEQLHNVIVVPFTWPANGGGAISGTLSYKSDKSDARASAGALNSAIGKIQQLHLLLTAGRKKLLQERADKKCRGNPQAAHSYFVKLVEKDCPVTINLLCHSMGNYVFKHTLSTSENVTSKLVFDNINLVAADANNARHAAWVGKLDVRKRINIVINENDSALRASRVKPGDEQLARLGHYTRQLDSPNAHYIDVTGDHVGDEHTYFKGDAVLKNEELKQLFTDMFNGRPVEQNLTYHADNNSYKF
jgi:esterase/lipase superfamily enzyme